jgi:hypothetical protein
MMIYNQTEILLIFINDCWDTQFWIFLASRSIYLHSSVFLRDFYTKKFSVQAFVKWSDSFVFSFDKNYSRVNVSKVFSLLSQEFFEIHNGSFFWMVIVGFSKKGPK